MANQTQKRVPPFKDASWTARTRETLLFLSSPRTWKEIKSWQMQRKLSKAEVLNNLAYLDLTLRTKTYTLSGEVVWVAASARSPVILDLAST